MLTAEENELLTRVGPGTPMGEVFRRFWLPAASKEELPTPDCDPIRTRILGEDLVGFRDSQGKVGFVTSFCPHRRAPLFFGRNEENGLRCVYHGWKFDVTGQCVDMPSEPPESNFKDKIQLKAYPTREMGPWIWIYMGPPEVMPELPMVEWAQHTEGTGIKWLQEANYMQGLEGNIDTAHVSYLHHIFGDDGSGLRNAVREEAENDAHPKLQVIETDYGFAYGGRRATGNGDFYWRVTQWMLPTFSLIPSPNWRPGGSVWVPIDDYHSYRYLFFTGPRTGRPLLPTHKQTFTLRDGTVIDALVGDRNRSNLYEMDRDMQRTLNYTGIKVIATQDQAMVEGMGYVCDRTQEHLGTSDAAVIAARRRLMKVARDLQNGIEPYPASHGSIYAVRPLDIVSPEPDLARLLEENADKVKAPIPA
ncbi:MAG TPA: Rieske 2Fe-2S domain-containing protein [Chloroflexota bacterium]|nr:Rieske 2Fe-2S domain-containing protein [Chloroflexota bacterium]